MVMVADDDRPLDTRQVGTAKDRVLQQCSLSDQRQKLLRQQPSRQRPKASPRTAAKNHRVDSAHYGSFAKRYQFVTLPTIGTMTKNRPARSSSTSATR